jgi:hypothetical protein
MNGIWTSWVFVCLVIDGDSYVKTEDLDHINQFNHWYLYDKSLDPIKQFNHRDLYISLTMDNSMSSESYDPPYIVVPSLN